MPACVCGYLNRFNTHTHTRTHIMCVCATLSAAHKKATSNPTSRGKSKKEITPQTRTYTHLQTPTHSTQHILSHMLGSSKEFANSIHKLGPPLWVCKVKSCDAARLVWQPIIKTASEVAKLELELPICVCWRVACDKLTLTHALTSYIYNVYLHDRVHLAHCLQQRDSTAKLLLAKLSPFSEFVFCLTSY